MLKKKTKKTEHIHVLTSKQLKRDANKLAKKYDMSLTDLVEHALIQAIEAEKDTGS